MRYTIILLFVVCFLTLFCAEVTDKDKLLRSTEILYEQGEYKKAAETIDKIVDQYDASQLVYFYGACTWALAGDKDKALDYLEKTVDLGWLDYDLISEDKDLVSLKTESRYNEIISKLQVNLKKVEEKFSDKHNPLEIIQLPDPRYNSETSIEKSLLQRRSVRKYKDEPITLEEISQILWAAYGVTKPIPNGPAFLRGGLKTAPSAGALYPLELYVTARNVTGLPAGIYKYKPEDHTLLKIFDGDVSTELAKAALDQPWVKEAPANIVYSAVFSRTTDKYGDRARERYVCMDLGHSAENIYLQCESLGLVTVAIGAFIDINLKKVINMT
ncbi:MAG: SagB/ThcOx family dehydrogenase, partial [Candidatus Cloacimonetes bacterium]|nr:SagB/ThcOx family dehydrogenase [Candidatus Cloacimonadota bacterium]